MTESKANELTEVELEVQKAAAEYAAEQSTAAPQAPRVSRTRRRSDVKRPLNIPTLDKMEVLEPQQFVVSVPDPEDDTKEWDLLIKELDPGELALLQETAFARNAVTARSKLEALNIDPDDESPENLEKMQEYLRDEDGSTRSVEFREYQIRVIELGTVQPVGLSRVQIIKWADRNIQKVYDAIMGGNTAIDAVDAFPSETSGSGDGS